MSQMKSQPTSTFERAGEGEENISKWIASGTFGREWVDHVDLISTHQGMVPLFFDNNCDLKPR